MRSFELNISLTLRTWISLNPTNKNWFDNIRYPTWLAYERLWRLYKDCYIPPGPSLCKMCFFYWLNILIIKWETLELRAEIVLSNRKKRSNCKSKYSRILNPYIYFDFCYLSSKYKNVHCDFAEMKGVNEVGQLVSSHQLATYYHGVYRNKLITRAGSFTLLQGIIPSQG